MREHHAAVDMLPTSIGLTTRIALCLVGEPRGVLSSTLRGLQEHVVKALRQHAPVDLFVVSSAELPTTALDNEAVSVLRVEEAPPERLAAIQRTGPSVWDSWNFWLDANDTRATRASPGNFLAQINKTSICWRGVQERERRLGFRYTAVGKARLDQRWFAPLPPRAWSNVAYRRVTVVPTNLMPLGVNDRFVLAPRRAFEVYAGLYDAITKGSGPWGVPGAYCLNPEHAMSEQLEYYNTTIEAVDMPFCLVTANVTANTTGAPCAIVCRQSQEGIAALETSALRQAASSCSLLPDPRTGESCRQGC